eukprot:NODE_61_length_25240_cov_0.547194.p7 type:complete len:389 gc:universal NODE_61_length_25240_cov_0.547194:16889-15723(-)
MDHGIPTAYSAGQDGLGVGILGIAGRDQCRTPQPIPIVGPKNVVDPVLEIVAGGLHSIVRTKRGIYTFGLGDLCATGRPNSDSTPTLTFPEFKPISKIAAADNLTLILIKGKLYIFGSFRDDNGTIGIDNANHVQEVPLHIPIGKDEEVVDIKAGDNHVVVLTKTGRSYTFGDCTHFQTGFRSSDRVNPNTNVRISERWCVAEAPVISNVKLIGAGSFQSFFVTFKNEIYCCGINASGQLGWPAHDPDTQTIRKNAELFRKLCGVEVKDSSGNVTRPCGEILQIEGGAHNTIFLVRKYGKNNKLKNHVYAIGSTRDGLLGLKGKATGEAYSSSPIEIDFPDGVEIKSISCGACTALALSKDGEVYSWVFLVNVGLDCKSYYSARYRHW